ncbi:hypothetical protein Adu01nite_16870 [Paractinoplanes durhamensis]|uniref:Uncharacterized protein n=1 Tax=Paractinoplanes durhamensis TaxID=113563 RepID=A0ABQ3YS32_9ACTN|nr:hypothetical protein Adu01nite_16870 [Actinoplanes durhamensis]
MRLLALALQEEAGQAGIVDEGARQPGAGRLRRHDDQCFFECAEPSAGAYAGKDDLNYMGPGLIAFRDVGERADVAPDQVNQQSPVGKTMCDRHVDQGGHQSFPELCRGIPLGVGQRQSPQMLR